MSGKGGEPVSFERRDGYTAEGLHWWTNVLYDAEGFCLGGDAHWLRPSLADEAVKANGWVKR